MTLQGLNFTNLLTKILKKTEKFSVFDCGIKESAYICNVKFKVQPVRGNNIIGEVLGIGNDPRQKHFEAGQHLAIYNV